MSHFKHSHDPLSKNLRALLSGVFALSMTLSTGCAADGQDDAKSESSSKKSKKKKKKKNKKDKSSSKKEKKDKKDSEDEEKGEKDKKGPTKKKIGFKLEDELSDLKNVRLVLHPEFAPIGTPSELGDALADVPAKFKDQLLTVTANPIAEDKDLGKEGFTVVWASLYLDKDKSEDYSSGDRILAATLEMVAYAREGNSQGLEEWTRFDMGENWFVPITKPLELIRIDNIESNESLRIAAKTPKVDKSVGRIALVSLKEAKDFSGNFDDSPRGPVLKVDRDKEVQELKLKEKPNKKRFGKKLPDYLPQFRSSSIGALGGFKGSEDSVTKDSELLTVGCIKGGPEDETYYEPVWFLWIDGGKDWVSGPASAHEILVFGYTPGWNAVSLQIGKDGSVYAFRLKEKELELLSFDKGCLENLPG